MKQSVSHPKKMDELLIQDAAVSEDYLTEQRRRLMAALERAERMEKLMRRAAIVSSILLGGMVCVMAAFLVQFPVARVVGGVITFILLVVAGTTLSLYNDKYRPEVSARRTDLQAVTLADLQRQIQELKKSDFESRSAG